MNCTFQNGQKVRYIPRVGQAEHGIVKSQHPTNTNVVFVVYKCAGDWDNYQNYTAASTEVSNLREEWV